MKPRPLKDWNLKGKAPLLALLLLLACGPEGLEEAERPAWVMPPDSMTDLMTDIHLVEGARIGKRTIGDTLPISVYYQLVWDKYDLDKEMYDSLFSYYSRHPAVMEEIYNKVLQRLSEMEAQSMQKSDSAATGGAKDSAQAAGVDVP